MSDKTWHSRRSKSPAQSTAATLKFGIQRLLNSEPASGSVPQERELKAKHRDEENKCVTLYDGLRNNIAIVHPYTIHTDIIYPHDSSTHSKQSAGDESSSSSSNSSIIVENDSSDSSDNEAELLSDSFEDDIPEKQSSESSSRTEKSKPAKRKRRVLFSKQQTDTLQRYFGMSLYVNPVMREVIAKAANMNPEQVKIWFQNNRYKMKKQLADSDGRKLASAVPHLLAHSRDSVHPYFGACGRVPFVQHMKLPPPAVPYSIPVSPRYLESLPYSGLPFPMFGYGHTLPNPYPVGQSPYPTLSTAVPFYNGASPGDWVGYRLGS